MVCKFDSDSTLTLMVTLTATASMNPARTLARCGCEFNLNSAFHLDCNSRYDPD